MIAVARAAIVSHCLIVLFILGPIGNLTAAESDAKPIASLYPRAEVFHTSIASAEALNLDGRRVSGLTVPHHLVAADLIARAFAVAAGNRYDKIILLSPDHFKRSRLSFATTRRDFDTVFGVVPSAVSDVERLVLSSLIAEDSSVLEKEHGVAAILPYIRHYFPDTPVIAVTVAIRSTVADWEQFLVDLAPSITKRTLIVQSTDFSHYL
ncbi:MAG: AmmeMemoRadiSam system protein B, partial [bacterium]|nr:AmmeMemoRadiSam system protein B [bacterium]